MRQLIMNMVINLGGHASAVFSVVPGNCQFESSLDIISTNHTDRRGRFPGEPTLRHQPAPPSPIPDLAAKDLPKRIMQRH